MLPCVPAPADAKISPVGFSDTVIFNTFLSLPSETKSYSTLPKIFKDFRLFIDLVKSNSLKGSPSSTSKLSLTTFSSVILFPNIFTLVRYFFSNSFISNVSSSSSVFTIFSLNDAFINS